MVEVTDYSKKVTAFKQANTTEPLYKYETSLQGLSDAIGDQFDTSTIGSLYRQYAANQTNLLKRYDPTEEERKQIVNMIGFNEDDWDIVLRGADNFDQVKNNIEILRTNRQIMGALANSHWSIGIASSVGYMAGDPVEAAVLAGTLAATVATGGSAAPVAGALAAGRTASIAGRIGLAAATNAAAGAASSYLNNEIAGTERDVWMDALVAAGFAGTLTGISEGARALLSKPLGRTINNHNARLEGEPIPNVRASQEEVSPLEASPNQPKDYVGVIDNNPAVPKGVLEKAKDVIGNLVDGIPSVEIKQRILKYIKDSEVPEDVKDFLKKFTHYEEGVGKAGDHRQYLTKGPLYMEEVEGLRLQDNYFNDALPNLQARLARRYGDDDLSEYIHLRLENSKVPPRLQHLEKDSGVDELVDIYKKSYEERGRLLVLSGVIEKTFNKGFYSPLVLDLMKIHNFVKDFTKVKENTGFYTPQEYLADYLLRGIKDDAAHLDEMQKYYTSFIKDTPRAEGAENFNDWLAQEARNSAKEFLDQGRSTRNDSSEIYDEFLIGFRFKKHRLPWNTAYEDNTLAGMPNFSLNQLRTNTLDAHRLYRARSTGAIADKRIFNADYDEVERIFNEMGARISDAKLLKPGIKEAVVKDLNTLHRRAYGMIIADGHQKYGLVDATSNILRNLTFAGKGTYMALNSFMELNRAIRAYGVFSMFKLVPGAGTLFRRWVNNGFTKEDLKSIKGFIVGDEIRTRLNLSATMRNSKETYKYATRWEPLNNFVATVVGASDYLAQLSPGGLAMRYATLRINDVYQTYALNELVRLSHNMHVKRRGFVSDDALRKLNISKEDFNHTLEYLKTFYSINKRGNVESLRPIEDLGLDPVSMYTLRRFMKYVTEETMQRRNIDDIFIWERSTSNPIINLALQFKNFSIMSYRKRFLKMINTFSDEGALSATHLLLTSAALTSLITIGTVYVKSLGLKTEDKKKFYERSLGVRELSDLTKPENFSNLAFYTMFNRMPEMAAPSLALNSLGIGTGTKTTAATGYGNTEDSLFIKDNKISKTIADMIPVSRTLDTIGSTIRGGINYTTNTLTDSFTKSEETKTIKQLYKAFDLTPTLPYFTNMVKEELRDDVTGKSHEF